jgi:pyruvate formate lyase activating enzyme
MKKGIIFDIKRYAIHDGPGIRTTVFLKGCPLQCQWCQNPEGIESKPEILLRSQRCAEDCEACVPACPQGAVSKKGCSVEFETEKCDFCRKCEEVCVYDALEVVGREVTVHDALEEIERDRVFFEESGGGITFSGGEPLMQLDFVKVLLNEIKQRNIHTTLDTSGYVNFTDLERINNQVDLFLYDIKIIDDERHKKYTGVSNKIILENLRRLSKKGTPVTVRIPLISGINDDEQSAESFAEYLKTLKNIKHINLLPYHKGGCEKYKNLRKEDSLKTFRPPTEERIGEITQILVESGFSVKTGG